MEQILEEVTKEHECIETDVEIPGKMFKHFITPFVETTLAVGKVDLQEIDPLMVVSPRGLMFIAKTVREKGDGEGCVFFITNQITSPEISYICMDFDQRFLNFCRNVRMEDIVKIHFNREFFFINVTKIKKEGVKKKSGRLVYDSRWFYKASANSIEDIQREVAFSLKLMREAPKKWTAQIKIPAREVKKFYVNVWRFLHRAVFLHRVRNNGAVVVSYSEDALRDLFSTKWSELGFDDPLFETAKRRFFMARHFVSGEDGVICNGEGEVVLRANWRVLNDMAQSGLDFELNFSDLTNPYGIVARDENSLFMHISENCFDRRELVYSDINQTVKNIVTMPRLDFDNDSVRLGNFNSIPRARGQNSLNGYLKKRCKKKCRAS